MGVFVESVKKVAHGALNSFKTFPASMGAALVFALVTVVRISLDWNQQESYNFLLNSLNWALALGVAFGMVAVAFVRSRKNEKSKFAAANVATVIVVAVSFLLLYFFGGYKYFPEDKYQVLRGIATARMAVAILINLVSFVIFAAAPKKKPNFAKSLFMTQKAFFIAIIYGGVLMGGLSSVAGAFESLLYSGMSYKVYQYLGAAVGFMAFAIFAGYFPDLSLEEADERRISAESQPKFVETLFSYIMVPIIMALTVVFLIWSVKTVVQGIGGNFLLLSGIASGYALVGLWLHIMVTEHDSGMAKVFKKVYPIAALVILAFELWALIEQLGRSSMKSEEYWFGLVWLVAVISVLLLIFRKSRGHIAIAVVVSVVAIISVLPAVGYHQLPPSMQISRLESLLESEGMLVDGAIVPAESEPEREVREGITDAVLYLAYQRDVKFPSWFSSELEGDVEFKKAFGFEKVWPEYDIENPEYMGLTLVLEPSTLDISGYDWAVCMQDTKGTGEAVAKIEGARGDYELIWNMGYRESEIPEFKVYLDDNLIIQKNMNDYIDEIKEKYLRERGGYIQAGMDEMSLKLESDEVDVLLVFNNLDVYMDERNNTPNYNIQINTVYVDEK